MHNELSYPYRLKYWGADTETVEGNPYSIQVSDGKNTDFLWVNSKNVLDKFLTYFEPKLWRGQVNVCYFHNLQFDLAVLLKNYHHLFEGKTKLDFTHKGVKFEFVIGRIYFGFIKFPDNKTLKLLDTQAFFTEHPSLDNLAKTLSLPVRKMAKPKRLGKVRYTSSNFINYAKNDAVVTYYIAQYIISQYKKFNTRICVSLPQFSSRIFRHYFMRKTDHIRFPNPEIVRASILSYHGGKNGWYVQRPTVIDKCYELDIVSAYPYAMTKMPNFISNGVYSFVKSYSKKYEGIYCISGKIKNCKYPIIYDHTFKVVEGKFSNIWVTSYELREAIKKEEVSLSTCFGFVWIPDTEETYNPFFEFTKHFFKEKVIAKTIPERLVSKLILNSLYGKTIQTIQSDKDKKGYTPDFFYDIVTKRYIKSTENNIFFASGMFNPFIATLITGFVRAYIHNLEHKYSSLHTSTDSIKTLQAPYKKDLGDKLGKLKVEVYGKCYLIRNKLYLHYNNKGELKKYGLHGFLGKPKLLLELFMRKKTTYNVKHLFLVKEALKQDKIPLKEEGVKRILDVDFSKIDYI
jgi:hypothetical protein